MSDWDDAVADMDSALFAEFSTTVTLHLDEDTEVEGIFDNPYTVGSMKNGGSFRDSAPELFLMDDEAVGVEKDLFITISNVKWQVVKMPEPDGTGLTKVTLGHTSGESIEEPTIRFRS